MNQWCIQKVVVKPGVVRYENELCMLSDGGNAGDTRSLVVTEIGDGKEKPANTVGQSTSIFVEVPLLHRGVGLAVTLLQQWVILWTLCVPKR